MSCGGGVAAPAPPPRAVCDGRCAPSVHVWLTLRCYGWRAVRDDRCDIHRTEEALKRLALFAALALLLTLAAACGAPASGASVSAPTMPAEVATPAAPTPAGPTPIQAADPVWTFDGGATPFNTPLALAIDTRDHLYVTDSRNGRVVKLDADGHVLGQWGSPGDRPGQFSRLLGVAADAQGNVYVTDGGEHMRVQKF